jgi:hypothetical protein
MQVSAAPPSPATDASRTSPRGKAWPLVLINFWLDATLFLAVVVLVWTAVILQFAFPPATSAAGWVLWGWTYDDWAKLQFGALCVAAGLTVEHLVLHWNWVCTVLATRILRRARPDEANQAIYGVATFICIFVGVVVSLAAAMVCIRSR